MNLILLILEGRYEIDRKCTHCHSRRAVSVDLDNKHEREDVQRFLDPDTGCFVWGFGSVKGGWWKIVDAFEMIEPNEDVHENKYPVSFHLDKEQFAEIIREANRPPVDPSYGLVITISEPKGTEKPTVYAAMLPDGRSETVRMHIERVFSERLTHTVAYVQANAICDAADAAVRNGFAWIDGTFLVEVTQLK